MDKNKIIQSYVFKNSKCYFVSTANRENEFGIYSETIVWEYNQESKEKGKLLAIDSGIDNSATKHYIICDKILEGINPENL